MFVSSPSFEDKKEPPFFTSKMPRFIGDRTFASDPGKVRLSNEKLRPKGQIYLAFLAAVV